MASFSGASQALGQDTRDGFMLYVGAHNGQLGGHPVDVTQVDEGDGGSASVATAARLIGSGRLVALAGITHDETVEALLPSIRQNHSLLVTAGDQPNLNDVSRVWSTNYLPDEPGRAIADFLRTSIDGPVWAMASDDAGGHSNLAGFVNAFAAGGGRLANDVTPLYTPGTTDFLPFLADAKASGAKAIYCYYVGDAGITFVQQYAQSDARDLPLFATGLLTEGSALAAEGRAALGIRTVLNYAPGLDNSPNRDFVDQWLSKHRSLPTAYAMAGWDAALVLDKAIASAGPRPTADSVNDAMAHLGQIDSPRGTWEFSGQHSPVQQWYLREVATDGRAMTNSLIQDLDVLGA
jgi:branched-chain amino acid transport system substrate-binding protein